MLSARAPATTLPITSPHHQPTAAGTGAAASWKRRLRANASRTTRSGMTRETTGTIQPQIAQAVACWVAPVRARALR